MKNVFRKTAALLLAASMLIIPVGVSAEATALKWNNTNLDGYKDQDLNATFGGKSATKITGLSGGKATFGYTSDGTTGGTEISDNDYLIMDVNIATNGSIGFGTRTNRDIPLTKVKDLTKNVWHSARLVVSPNRTTATEPTSHKLYIDGVLKVEYKDKPENWNGDDHNKIWKFRVDGLKDTEDFYYTDLRISSSSTEPDGGTVPTLTTDDKYIVSKNYVIGTDVEVYDLKKDGAKFYVTRGNEAVTEGMLQSGDAILCESTDKFVNTYIFKSATDKNEIVTSKDFNNNVDANNCKGQVVSEQYGKVSDDTSLSFKGKKNGEVYYTPVGNMDTKVIGGGYIVFEMNVLLGNNTSGDYAGILINSNQGFGITPRAPKTSMNTDCWNKIVWILNCNEPKVTVGTTTYYTCDMYINGKHMGKGNSCPYMFGEKNPNDVTIDTVRIKFETDSTVEGDLGLVDDVKIYETWTRPTISEYTENNTDKVVFDENTAYMASECDVTAAFGTGATVAKKDSASVIINRGDENYSRYNVRALDTTSVKYDSATKEFWGAKASVGEDDKLIAVTYDADGKLVGADILSGTAIGGESMKVVKGAYTAPTSGKVKLYFWNMSTLAPNAANATVE